MTKVIYTVQIANARAAHMEEVPVLDITVKSGERTFAPTWDMVMNYKQGILSSEGYVEQYEKLMRISQSLEPQRWKEILDAETIALACYCKPGNFCHRLLLKDMLLSMMNEQGDEAIDGGELV